MRTVLPLFIWMAFGAGVPSGWSQAAAERTRELEQAREMALNYSRSLPDFMCTEVVRRFVDWRGTGDWARADTLTVQVAYFGQKESYKLIRRNNAETSQGFESLAGAFTRGEFGSTLRWIFEPESAADFRWERSDTIGRRAVSVWSYSVDRAHSRYALRSGTQSVVTAYHGLVFLETGTGRALRVTTEADIPEDFTVRRSATTVDYGLVDVGGRQYLLPVSSESLAADVPLTNVPAMKTRLAYYRNLVQYRGYKKFTAESSLKFEGVGENP